jgi:hypothetical protein
VLPGREKAVEVITEWHLRLASRNVAGNLFVQWVGPLVNFRLQWLMVALRAYSLFGKEKEIYSS